MSVDDRDFFAETVTTGFATSVRDPWLEPEPPKFLAMGTQVELDELVREEDLEVTRPMPKMTMAELVYACRTEPTKLAEPVAPRLARGSMAMLPLADQLVEVKACGSMVDDFVEVKARSHGTVPPMSADGQPQGVLIDQVEMPAAVPPTSRKIRPRRTRPRARTIAPRRLTSVELREVANTRAEQAERPRTRAECAHEQRPCPWVSCKHHLYLDVNPRTGSIKLNFPDLEPWELKHTCALDVADDGGHTLEEVGDITNLTRERIRQLEFRGLLELRGRSRNLR
jgi:Sigma-70, region 4